MNIFKKKNTMNVLTYGDPFLKKNADRVEIIDDELKALVDVMITTMYESDGIGLAATQVGESKRMFVLGVPVPKEGENPFDLDQKGVPSPGELKLLPLMPLALINPEITPSTSVCSYFEEGCLSVPDVFAPVKRPNSVFLSAQLIDGEKINLECSGYLARVIQHEMDHLDGTLFVERLEAEERDKVESQLKKLKKD